MKVTVSKTVPKSLAKDLIAAAKFYANILMDPRMVKTIKLKIRVLKYDPQTESLGECEEVEPRTFVIEIYNEPTENIFETLAHEMVHVKQYAKRELGDEVTMTMAKGKKEYCATKWKGEFWTPKKREDSYFDSPWEVEAYGRGIGLYSRWKKKKNLELSSQFKNDEQLMLPMDLPEQRKK